MQTIATLSVVVKGDRRQAERELRQQMNRWLNRDQCAHDGTGYPIGTLLYYEVRETRELNGKAA